MYISCCMIVKNEAIVLEDTLKKAKPFFEEIIIVDTGSTDETINIARKYTDKIYEFEWHSDFSSARNFSISKAKSDWVFILDADEYMIKFDKANIMSTVKDESFVGRITRRNTLDNGQTYIERIKRFFNKNHYYYQGIIHEQIVGKSSQKPVLVSIDIVLNHIGYRNEVLKRTGKVDRNIELLKEAIVKDAKDPYLYYQLGKSFSLKKELLSAVENYERAIELIDNFYYEYVEDLVESYGYALINSCDYKAALKLEKYTQYYEGKPDYCFLMGLIYMNNALFKKAIDWFVRCIGLKDAHIEGTNSFLPCYNIGVIYECLGHTGEAMQWYARCNGYIPAKERMEKIGG